MPAKSRGRSSVDFSEVRLDQPQQNISVSRNPIDPTKTRITIDAVSFFMPTAQAAALRDMIAKQTPDIPVSEAPEEWKPAPPMPPDGSRFLQEYNAASALARTSGKSIYLWHRGHKGDLTWMHSAIVPADELFLEVRPDAEPFIDDEARPRRFFL